MSGSHDRSIRLWEKSEEILVLSEEREMVSYFKIVSGLQGDHSSGKPGNVREFDSCHGNVRYFAENQGIVREKILSGKSCLKLFIVSCIFVSIHVFSTSLLYLKC